MSTTDDTVRKGKQAREDVLLAMLESGLLPGSTHLGLESEQDVEAMYKKVAEDKPTLVVYRVSRNLAEHGAIGGLVSAATLLGLPEEAKGKVMFAFDGWADDDRELFEIPVVVAFCRAMLLGSLETPQLEHSKRVLGFLINEHEHAFVGGNMVYPQWLDAAGGIWLCSAAFKEKVYYRRRAAKSGWMREYSKAVAIWNWAQGVGPFPH